MLYYFKYDTQRNSWNQRNIGSERLYILKDVWWQYMLCDDILYRWNYDEYRWVVFE